MNFTGQFHNTGDMELLARQRAHRRSLLLEDAIHVLPPMMHRGLLLRFQ